MHKVRKHLAAPLLALSILSLAGCGSMAPVDNTPPSLYDRLGGKPAIVAVIEDFVANVAADRRINNRFAKTDIPRLKQLLVEQVCAGTGGPCEYTGRDMQTTHKGMRITHAAFDYLVEDLVKSLDKFKVPAEEKDELLGILGGMRPAIVGQ